MNNKREFEVVLWGATGFTGALVARHLAETYGTDLNWAIAGRNRGKLEQLRRDLELPDLAILEADSNDRPSLDALAERAAVVCTTVGPYALYGDDLVAACVAAGTGYCDLTGEVQWMARMIDRHGDAARDSGARIVHTCGFDSIPSDLGTLFLQRAMFEQYGEYADRVKSRVGRFSGAASGGTIASMIRMFEEATRDAAVREAMSNPYSLNPPGERSGPDRPDRNRPVYDEDFQQWSSTFIMAAVNSRVVRRSNALAGYPWGRDFRFDERQLTGQGGRGRRRAAAICGGTGLTTVAMAISPLRKLSTRFLPAPGEGPSPEAQRRGHFELFFHGSNAASGNSLRARVSGDRDPGYGATSRMLGEAAVCLARDELDCGGGFWTPASAMGDQLVQRLEQSAGMTFELLHED